MSKFSDYVNESKVNESKINHSENKTIDNNNMEDLINKYSKYSSDELMQEFMKMTIEKKRKGQLGEEELSMLKNTILPYLNDEQKIKLESLLNLVSNVK